MLRHRSRLQVEVIDSRTRRKAKRFTRWRLSHPIIGVLLLLAIVASACNEIPAEPITFDNQADQTIIVVRSFSESVYKEIAPGSRVTDRSLCVDPDLEARLENGAVVASRPGPFCQGDPEWVITQAEVDAAK